MPPAGTLFTREPARIRKSKCHRVRWPPWKHPGRRRGEHPRLLPGARGDQPHRGSQPPLAAERRADHRGPGVADLSRIPGGGDPRAGRHALHHRREGGRRERALVPEVEKSIQYACRVRKDCQRHEDCRGEAEEIVRALLEGIPEIRRKVNRDVMAAFRGDPAARSQEEVILSYPGVEAILVHRIAHELWIRDVAMIPRMMSEYIHGVTGIDIHPGRRHRRLLLHRPRHGRGHRGDGGHRRQREAVPGRHPRRAQRAEGARQQEAASHDRGRGDHLRRAPRSSAEGPSSAAGRSSAATSG